jgi:hypothetical protein
MKRTWPLLILIFIWISFAVPFTGCDPDDDDGRCDTCSMVYKPNIYIYPDVPMHLNISLDFPQGGHVVKSEPAYNSGWSVMVDTNGMIDNQYRYLFYESRQPDIWQKNKAWIIEQGKLKSFFEQNLTAYGFTSAEIADFTEYWIPRMTLKPYYAIYPQTIDIIQKVILLNASEKPINLLRLFYLIEGLDQPAATVVNPESPSPIDRNGYTITEWGVIIE